MTRRPVPDVLGGAGVPQDDLVAAAMTVGVWRCLCGARWEVGRIKCPYCQVEHLSWDLPPWLRDGGWRIRLPAGPLRADHDTLGSVVMMDVVELQMEMRRRLEGGGEKPAKDGERTLGLEVRRSKVFFRARDGILSVTARDRGGLHVYAGGVDMTVEQWRELVRAVEGLL